jgi:hypothetical protein
MCRLLMALISLSVFQCGTSWPVFGQSRQGRVDAIDAQHSKLATELDASLAIVVRESLAPTGETDWWKSQVDTSSHGRVNQLVSQIRASLGGKKQMIRPSDMEVDFIELSVEFPFFMDRDGVHFKGGPTKVVRVLSKEHVLSDRFVADFGASLGDQHSAEYEKPVVLMKVIGAVVDVRIQEEWVKGAKTEAERVGRVMEQAPAKARLTIVWHNRSDPASSLVCTEINVVGTPEGWRK